MPWKPTVHQPAGAKPASEVKRGLDRQRLSAARRGYDSRWRKARACYLAEHPLCVSCLGEGRLTAATVVDHVIVHGGDRQLFWDRGNWQGLCKQHHDAKTVQDGRWGRRHLSDGAARSIYGCDVHGMPLDPDHPWNRPGGESVASGVVDRNPAGRAPCAAAKFRRGGMRPLSGGIPGFPPAGNSFIPAPFVRF